MFKPLHQKLRRNALYQRVIITILFIIVTIYTYRSIYSIPNHLQSSINKNIKYPIQDPIEFNSELRAKLIKQYPYDSNRAIPPTIWQTWKTPIDSPDMHPKLKRYSSKWEEVTYGIADISTHSLLNLHNTEKSSKKDKDSDEVLDESITSFHHHVVPDSVAPDLIKSLYFQIPEIYKAYDILPKSILKADFFRYLILFARGGLYTDMDTLPLKNLNEWVVFNETIYNEKNNAGLIIGIEADPDRDDWADYYVNRIQFCQWSMLSKVGHPMLRELIIKITEITLEKFELGTLEKYDGEGDGIMNWTGPGIWTKEIFKYFNKLLSENKGEGELKIINKTGENKYNKGLNIYKDGIDWRFFTLMEEVILIDDVMILPITCFSPGVGHMGSKSINDDMAYIRHMFEGSWKPDNERQVIKDDGYNKPKE